MKTILTILLFAIVPYMAYAQLSQNDQTVEKQKANKETTPIAVAYRLFPTTNMWTFIKLNTRNGLMWQVQYVVQGDNRFETFLSSVPLVTIEKEANDRFTLYPTQNIYTFILLDQFDGRVWQVQWSQDAEYRFIVPIE